MLRGHGVGLSGLAWPARGRGRPPLLLVHATSFCAEVWGPVLERLPDAGPSVAIDQRGHGRSDAPDAPGAYAWTQLARDVAAVAGAFASPPVLVGHSSGATACLAAAGMVSEPVAGVVLVEPVLFDPSAAGAAAGGDSFAGSGALAARARRRRAAFASVDAARAALAGRFPYAGFAPASLEAFLVGGLAPASQGVALRCAPEREAWAYEGAAALDVWPWVGRVRAPVALLLAERSAVPAPLRERLLQGLGDATPVTVAGATHFAALERPAEVGDRIRAWLEGLPQPPSRTADPGGAGAVA